MHVFVSTSSGGYFLLNSKLKFLKFFSVTRGGGGLLCVRFFNGEEVNLSGYALDTRYGVPDVRC